MMRKLLPILLAIIVSTGLQARPHHRNYVGDSKDHIAYPIGGLGSGIFPKRYFSIIFRTSSTNRAPMRPFMWAARPRF